MEIFNKHGSSEVEILFSDFLDGLRKYHHKLICQEFDKTRKGGNHSEIENLKVKCQRLGEFRDRMEKIYTDVFGKIYKYDIDD